MFAAFALLLISLSVAALADHQPCQSPNMTGTFGVSNTNKGTYTVGGYVYDSGAKRLRFKVNESLSYNAVNLDVLIFFEEGVFYEIDSKKQSCKKKSMQPVPNPLQLPPDAKFLTKMQLGRASVQEEGMIFNVWMVTTPALKAPYFPSVSMGCLPVSSMYTSDSTSLMISNMDVELEIKDPDLLIVPSFCEGATLEATPEGTVNSFYHFFL